MKKLLILLTLTITTVLQAQAPQGFNYQATVRNNSGDLILNTNVYFKFNVIQGSETAVPIFTEIHYVPTDDLGQVNLVIGQGTANTGVFSELDWSLGSYYLGIELDTGNGYVAMGTTQLLSVPYALYAANSGNSTPTTPNLQSVLAENNSAGQQQIKNLLDPTDGADAVTKSYVDALSNPQGLMNFNGWDNYQVWQDNATITLTPNSFVFVNANETTLVFPDGPDNCCFGDVIYVYVMDADPLTPLSFNLQANGFPVAVGGGDLPLEFTSTDIISGAFWSVGLKTIVNVGDYWMVAGFQGQIITDSDIDDDGDGFTENQGDCDDNNATIYPPVIPNQEITICSGETFVFDPVNNPPTTLVPEGTTYTWTVTDNFNEIVGEESSTNSNQSQISQTLNNYGGVFYGISYEVTPYSPSGCEGQTFELIVYVTLPTEMSSINDMVLMNGESNNFEFYSYPQNEDVIYDWASDIEFGAGLMGVGNTSFTAINSSTIAIIANLTVTATVTTNGVTCASPPKTFTITVNPDADTVTDQNGNSYNYLSYGNQAWTVENAEMVTYRDGTEIPQVTSNGVWADTTTGAWAYYDNDPTKGKLYNWYAVMGIHDEASLLDASLRKEFAPEGWHVPTDGEWITLENYLIDSGYNYDNSAEGNKIAQAMASTTGWNYSDEEGAPGNNQSANNDSEFNAVPEGYRSGITSEFQDYGSLAIFWTSSENEDDVDAWRRNLDWDSSALIKYGHWKTSGISVRFVRDGDVDSNEIDDDADGYTENQGDCNDTNASVYPGATELEDNIDNDCDGDIDEGFEESGTELMLNGGFETWENSEYPSLYELAVNTQQEFNEVHSGNYAAKVTGGTSPIAQKIVGIVGGRTYTISMWYKVDADFGDLTDARIWSNWQTSQPSNQESINLTDDADALKGPNNDYLPSNFNNWTEYSVTLTAPAAADLFYFQIRTYSGAVVYYDDLSVIELSDGNNPNAQVNPIDDLYVCPGYDVDVNFSTTNTQGTTQYSWTNDNDLIGIPLSGISTYSLQSPNYYIFSNPTSVPQVSTITVTPELTFQGQATTGPPETFTVTVNPTAQVDPIEDITVNNGEVMNPITFTTSNISGTTTYTWINDTPSLGLASSGSGNIPSFTPNNTTTTPIVGTITVTPTFTNGGLVCAGPSISFTITVNPAAGGTGTVTDHNGNTYDYLTYGNQAWTVENAEMVTYRDGTPIPQVTSNGVWADTTTGTGAWCYINNDPTKPRLYNWYAVMGIHDEASLLDASLRKEFAPVGWHVPSDAEWTTLENYLISNGHNYDGTTTGNKIAKAMASTTGWSSYTQPGVPGNDQGTNNSSGFNVFPEGYRDSTGAFMEEGYNAFFWSSTEYNANDAWNRNLYYYSSDLNRYDNYYTYKHFGFSVRFVRD